MARCKLMATLGCLPLADVILPYAGEPIVDCAPWATGELMVRYLAQDKNGPMLPM
ncbi:hypothetical protein AIGOOFII_4299 [Methylobacterium marchantiae]|nr:hypothetical protein AIGOOFII_4299 [Methylobacterium marchantiae]